MPHLCSLQQKLQAPRNLRVSVLLVVIAAASTATASRRHLRMQEPRVCGSVMHNRRRRSVRALLHNKARDVRRREPQARLLRLPPPGFRRPERRVSSMMSEAL